MFFIIFTSNALRYSIAHYNEIELTLDSKVQRLAARLVERVRRGADVTTGAASCHALQDEALIRPDDPRRRVVR